MTKALRELHKLEQFLLKQAEYYRQFDNSYTLYVTPEHGTIRLYKNGNVSRSETIWTDPTAALAALKGEGND